MATTHGNPQSPESERALEAASNARLIAMAPELLAAARRLVAALEAVQFPTLMTSEEASRAQGEVSCAHSRLAGTIILLEEGPPGYDTLPEDPYPYP